MDKFWYTCISCDYIHKYILPEKHCGINGCTQTWFTYLRNMSPEFLDLFRKNEATVSQS